ncbi:MAG: hypothetical protein U0L17_06855 [Acutalibacteraceae bacterium]|nr:hypothetical protein [Acutalibacteraceae bacterium]
MTVTEKVAYLKGLASGLSLDANDNQVKLINAIIDTLDEMAEAMSELELDVTDISDQVDAVDEDLAEVEDYLFEPDEDEDEDLYEIKCPECGEEMVVSLDMLDNSVECTNCGATLQLSIDDDEEDIEE